jgi:hypothetical protein
MTAEHRQQVREEVSTYSDQSLIDLCKLIKHELLTNTNTADSLKQFVAPWDRTDYEYMIDIIEDEMHKRGIPKNNC